MATTIAIQELPANGGAINDLTFVVGDEAGMNFNNDGQTILIVKNTTADVHSCTVEGVPAQDSGRDGDTEVSLLGAIGATAILGPFKPRNWNTGTGAVELTMVLADAPNMEFAAVRYELG